MISALQLACDRHKITLVSVYLGIYKHKSLTDETELSAHKWLCTLNYKDRSATFEFLRHLDGLYNPSVADVMAYALNKTTADCTTFENWCGEFRFDHTNIKVLYEYLLSKRHGVKVIRMLGRPLYEELKRKTH